MRRKSLRLLVLILVITGWAPLASAGSNLGQTVLDAAEESFASGDYGKVIRLAQPALESETEKDRLLRFHYLLGKSLYEQTAADVRACREAGTLKKGYLQDGQAESMKGAMAHFQQAYDLDPGSPLAPESLFMTGKILDYGCLNHFKEAIVQYEACYQKYPDTEFGKMARERYDRLLPFMSGGAHGGGGRHP